MIRIIKCKKKIEYADYVQHVSLLESKDHILFDMTQTEYIPASMIGFLMALRHRGIQFDLMLSSQVEYILRIKNVYDYLTGGSHE